MTRLTPAQIKAALRAAPDWAQNGDSITRTFQFKDFVAAIRFVETTDFMTADWVHIDYEVLGRISSRIINEVPGINRVVYDISSKPPSTIEWE